MNASTRLENYLQALRRRIQALIFARSAAAATAILLAATCIGVWWLQTSNYLPQAAVVTRVVVVLALVGIAIGLVWLPLRRLRAGQGAAEFERRLPDQQGRIQTYLDARQRATDGQSGFMLELLAEDAAGRAEARPVRTVVSDRNLWSGVGVAGLALAVLVALMAFGPAHWGYASRYLLLGMQLPRDAVPMRRITLIPGDATVRRNSDLSVRATVEGFDPKTADLYVRFENEKQWQRAAMARSVNKRNESEWEFKLYALRGALRYYVVADQTRSSEHSVAVADLPRVEKVRLTYSYPEWTGLNPLVEETVRDIEAVADTKVRIEVFADGPLDEAGVMVNGKLQPLTAQGKANVGSIVVKQAGNYHIAAQVANETVNLTDDYRIDIISDQKPTVEIVKPARDVRATAIEEVPVRVRAKDDFRLREVQLRYSVNGGKWQSMNLGAGNKETDSATLLELEQLGNMPAAASAVQDSKQQLVPGDLVSYYAVAKDRGETVETDLFMVQVQPFERRFKEGQGGGGGGGDGEDQSAISERQKEILLATWNLQRSDERKKRTRDQLEENADMLADLQKTLAEQSRKVAERTRARVALDDDERIKTFVESMEKAATLMEPAARQLSSFKLDEAVPLEQQALQMLQRAEAAFRDVQISMSREDAASGSQTAQNFTEMFELEMDVEKNQYETQSQATMQNEKQDIDEAIRKLKELAERQEKLAQANQNKMPLAEQRWRQEQLRREAEDLKRQLAELTRQQQSSQAQARSQQRSQSQSGGESSSDPSEDPQDGEQSSDQQQDGKEGKQGQQGSEAQQRLANATESVKKALEEMRRAGNNGGDPEAAARSAREASRNLQQALRGIDKPKDNSLADTLEDMQRRTQRMARDQQQNESALYEAAAAARQANRLPPPMDPRQVAQLADSKNNMAEEVAELQKEMRDVLNEHRKDSPQAARKLAEALGGLENSNLKGRLTNSANRLRNSNGRAVREVAAGEGIITESMEELQDGLREAATMASKERNDKGSEIGAEELLADLAELRRSLREAQGGEPGEEERGLARDQQGKEGQGGRDGKEQREALANNSQQQERNGNQGGQPGQQGSESTERGDGAQPNRSSRTPSVRGAGLGAWDLENRGSLTLGPDTGRLRRDTNRIIDQVNSLTNRFKGQHLSQEEINALRRLAYELRGVSGNSVADKVKAMNAVVDQIELVTLSAVEKSKNPDAPRATVQSEDSAAYRETVAEYYRRLGNK